VGDTIDRSTLTMLRDDYGMPIMLSFRDLERCTGVSEKTFKNWLTRGRLPFPAQLYGGMRRVHIRDVAKWIDEGGIGKPKRKRGRPTATEKYRAQQAR